MAQNGKLEHTFTSILENNKKMNMKNLKISYLKKIFLLTLVVLSSVSCERNLSDDATVSTYSKTEMYLLMALVRV